MKFKERLLQGILIKRYKRFFVDIKYQNETITAHCPNSGSMMGLLNFRNSAWFSKSDNSKRKLKYTLQMIGLNKKLVGINTHLTNKIVLEALKEKRIKSLIKFNNIKTEAKFSDKTYQFSGGLHGVGVSVVNALAQRLLVQVKNHGKIYEMQFADGEVDEKLKIVGEIKLRDTGTFIRYWPNPKYFDHRVFAYDQTGNILIIGDLPMIKPEIF